MNYLYRLTRARLVWSAFILAVLGIYAATQGSYCIWDVIGLLAFVWVAGFPRNAARRAAKRDASIDDFNEAVDRYRDGAPRHRGRR